MLRKAILRANLRFEGLETEFAISKYFSKATRAFKAENSMKNRIGKRKKNNIVVYLENPQEGINFERLFMALSLLLSEKDVLEYLSREDGLFHISIKEKISAKA